MQITDALLTISNYNRPGTKRTRTTAIACHYIGNPGTSAKANRNWFESLKDGKGTKASCHYIIGLQGEILRLIPEDEISWCTNQANSYTISIEACHPNSNGKFTDATYKAYVELCADICTRWHLDPVAGGLVRHHDVTGKVCPKWFVDHPDDWETFKRDVAAKMQIATVGWIQDVETGKWWYRQGDGNYPKADWYLAFCASDKKYHWFLFDENGWMLTGRQEFKGKTYYLEESGALIGACMVSDASGALGYLV